MLIKTMDFQDITYPFRDGAYVMSYATQVELPVRVVRLETEDGHVGWGEIVRKPIYNTPSVSSEEERLRKAIAGMPFSRAAKFVKEATRNDSSLSGFSFGVETALLDYVARKADVPLYFLLGGRERESVPEYFSLSCGDPSKVRSSLISKAQGWPVVQIKLGVGDRQSDAQRIEAGLPSLADEQTILADFNGALNVEDALAMIAMFEDPRIIWEEPCNTVEANIEVARRSGRPVMFDQCLTDLRRIRQAITSGVAHSIVIKPSYLGGLEAARLARDMCALANIKMRIDGPWSGHIATAACLHLAIGAPQDLLIAGCDLRQPLDLDEDWGGTIHLPGHNIAPHDIPGHGVLPI